MEKFRKMVIVPENTYTNLLSQNREETPPYIFELVRLNGELNNILDNKKIPNDVKYVRFNEIMRKYLMLKNEQHQKINPTLNPVLFPPTVSPANVTNNILDKDDVSQGKMSLPESFKQQDEMDTKFDLGDTKNDFEKQDANIQHSTKKETSSTPKAKTKTKQNISSIDNQDVFSTPTEGHNVLDIKSPNRTHEQFRIKFNKVKHFIEKRPQKIKWNVDNQLINPLGQAIPGSDMGELIKEYVRVNKSKKQPVGYKDFEDLLKVENFQLQSPFKKQKDIHTGKGRHNHRFRITYW